MCDKQSYCHKCGGDILNDDDIECESCIAESMNAIRCEQDRIERPQRGVSEIDYLRTLLDGMASAQEQSTTPEAHYVIKPFIRSVERRLAQITPPKS